LGLDTRRAKTHKNIFRQNTRNEGERKKISKQSASIIPSPALPFFPSGHC